jgi:hypothetical protein
VTFWYGSESADSYLSLTGPDPTPDLLFSSVTFKMATKTKLFPTFFGLLLSEATSFFRD